MQRLLHILLLFPFLAFPGELEDYKLLIKNLSAAQSVNGTVETHYYNAAKPTAYKTEKGEFAYSNTGSYVKYDNYITISDGKYRLVVDSKKKIMMFNSIDKSELPKELTEQMQLPTISDSLVKKQLTLKYLLNDETTKVLELIPKAKAKYEKIEIEMNTTATALKRITYYFSGSSGGPSKIDILYKSFELNENVNNNLFSFSKYISLTKNSVALLPAYASYELVDYRKRK